MASAAPTATEPNGDAPNAETSVPTTDHTNPPKPSEPAADKDGTPGADSNGRGHDEVDESNKAAAEASASTPGAATGPASTEDASAKSRQKRRSSGGVPEHKSKKLNRKKSMPALHLDARSGDYYWVRMKGFPPWPAIICDEDMLPESLTATRPVTAMRPDGSYREDFDDGGKNVKDRTYPVMYLDTYEFSWTPNTDLAPIDMEEIQNAEQGKKSKSLWSAYQIAKEQHELPYFKDMLVQHLQQVQEEQERQARIAAEKQARKDKKAKRQSKDAALDEDEVMDDAPEAEADTKKSKKRKKAVDEDGDEKPAKTPKSIKLQSKKSDAGDSTSKSKSKPKPKPKTPKSSSKATPKAKAEPPMTEEERREKRHKEILFFRHKLQKGFLSHEPPKDDEMKQMADYFSSLENSKDIEASVIKSTKIHKVLKGIVKLTSIPHDEEFSFKERSAKLLESWSKLLGEDASVGVETKGHSGSKGPGKADAEAAEGPTKKESEVKENGDEVAKEESAEAPAEKATEPKDMTDVSMTDLKDEGTKTEETTNMKDAPKENGA